MAMASTAILLIGLVVSTLPHLLLFFELPIQSQGIRINIRPSLSKAINMSTTPIKVTEGQVGSILGSEKFIYACYTFTVVLERIE